MDEVQLSVSYETLIAWIDQLPLVTQQQLYRHLEDRLIASSVLESSTMTLLDLEGVGADLWDGVDAQEYVNELRNQWDESK